MRTRRSAVAVLSAGLLCLVTALSGTAYAHAKGEKGDPQPELKPFKIGAGISGGTVAIEPDGSLVVAYDVATKNTEGAIEVCVLKRGGTACTTKVELRTLSSDDVFNTPQVFALSNTHIVVLQTTCCDANIDGGDLLFSSTDGGKTFGMPVRVGFVSTVGAVSVGGNIVFIGGDPHSGTQVASIPDDATAPQLGFDQVTATAPSDVAISAYKNGVLAGSDVLSKGHYTTKVDYASSGTDFNTGPYTKVGTFKDEFIVGMSGSALLTGQDNGKGHLLLRLFNGTSYGSPHAVPGYKGVSLGLWATIDRDASGVTHIFAESTSVGPIYDLLETSTRSGTSWSGRTDLGNAIDNNTFGVSLDSTGSGMVLGGSGKEFGYPVLATQKVTFALSKSSIKTGKKVKGKGTVTVAAKGRKVWLQIERKGLWYNVASTKESASGSFTFTIKGSSTGTFRYRAVANDHAGYVQFGYSSGRSLTVKS